MQKEVNITKYDVEADKYDYLESIKAPVDDSYTAQNNYTTRFWVESYKTPTIDEIDSETNEIKINENIFLSDRIVDNIEVNTEKGIGASVKNKLQTKSLQFKEDLFAFAASMRNEVYRSENGIIDPRSFLQFCTRIYDGNNAAINNLIANGYFGDEMKKPSDFNFDKFITSCANEVFNVNILLPKDKDTKEIRYSEYYPGLKEDTCKTEDINKANIYNKKYDIDYSNYAENEEKFQNHRLQADSYKYLYSLLTFAPFKSIEKAPKKQSLKEDRDEYIKDVNIPVDDSYTAQNKYNTRIWIESYKTPSLEEVDPVTNKITINENGYLNERIIDNIEVNTEKGIGSSIKSKLQVKQETYRDDLYAFAASMKNEVDIGNSGERFDTRSFLQFCTRIFDGNNIAMNNLVEKGYFGKGKKLDEINLDKFITGCANEVFNVNVLLPKDKDTDEIKYSKMYPGLTDDTFQIDDVNLSNIKNPKYMIDYSDYADKEEQYERHSQRIDSYQWFYTIPLMTTFRSIEKEGGIKKHKPLSVEEAEKIAKDAEILNKRTDKLNEELEALNNGENKPENKPENEIEIHEEVLPLIQPTNKEIKTLKDNIKNFAKKMGKEENRTTDTFAKGIKDLFEDFPNFDRLPIDLRKECARDLKYNLDKNIDGTKQAEKSLNEFYNYLGYNPNMINRNDPKQQKVLQNMKEQGLHIDSLSSYFRLTEIHEKRHGLFWLFHPNQNKAEKAAIAEMKEVLKQDFKMTDKELEPYYVDKNGNKKLNSPKLGDAMIDAIISTCDKDTAKTLAEQKDMRGKQFTSAFNVDDKKVAKENENQVKFKMEDIYPELYGIYSLNKSTTNEKTVEKGINK